jgi:hypothetical protein
MQLPGTFLGITGPFPLPAYEQPGSSPTNFDAGLDATNCPYCNTTARRIGSQAYPWLCQQGHQFAFLANGEVQQLPPALTQPLFGIRNERGS